MYGSLLSKPLPAGGSLAFYQTTATIVPVLLLALLVQARIVDPARSKRFSEIVGLFVLVPFAAIAEIISLGALLTGRSARGDAELVGLLLAVMGFAVPWPILGSLIKAWSQERTILGKGDRQRWVGAPIC
jgi:hypothetical protein